MARRTAEHNDSSDTLQLANEAVLNDQPEMLSRFFLMMPLEQLDVNDTDIFFSRYMGLCAAYERPECLKVVFQTWDRVYPPYQKISLFSKLFLVSGIDVNTLAFTAKVMEEYTYLEVMDDLIKYDSAPYIPLACKRAIQVYGEQPYETYKSLLELSGDDNLEVSNFLARKIRAISPYASIPKWMADFRPEKQGSLPKGSLPLESEVKIPEKREMGFAIPDLDTIVELLTAGLESSGLTIEDKEEAKRVIRARISIATSGEKIEILRPVMNLQGKIDLQKDDDIYRVLGPANPLVDSSPEEMDYGGCRMFICAVFDFNHEHGYVEDWFEGFCNQCNLQIRRRWHAVRMPRPHGGWRGSYCSWKCVREAIDDTSFNPEGQPDLLTHLLVDEFETQINIIGIQDRTPDDEVEEEKVSNAITSTVHDPHLSEFTMTEFLKEQEPPRIDQTYVYPLETGFETFGLSQTPTDKTVEIIRTEEPPTLVTPTTPAETQPVQVVKVTMPTLQPLPEIGLLEDIAVIEQPPTLLSPSPLSPAPQSPTFPLLPQSPTFPLLSQSPTGLKSPRSPGRILTPQSPSVSPPIIS